MSLKPLTNTDASEIYDYQSMPTPEKPVQPKPKPKPPPLVSLHQGEYRKAYDPPKP